MMNRRPFVKGASLPSLGGTFKERQSQFYDKERTMEAKSLSYTNEGWILVERFITVHADKYFLVFKKGETTLKIDVPETVFKAFDGINIKKVTMTV